jgi:hypothetical protein
MGNEEDQMAQSRRYGKVDIPMIGEDEPVFILRGQDVLAESAIEMYRLLAEAHGCKVAEGLTPEINAFHEWPGEKRLPSWPAPRHLDHADRLVSTSRRH